MSIRNFLISRMIKSSTESLMKLTPEQRYKYNRKFMAANNSKVPSDVAVKPDVISGVGIEWVTPKHILKDSQGKVCLYFHGGAYVAGSMNSHRDMACYLAKKAKVKVLMVDYRLAPEHPFPAAHEDALTVYKSMLKQGFFANDIVIAGDSAGANLALSTLINIKNEKLPLPDKCILFSPWLDLTHGHASIKSNAKTDVMLNAQILSESAELYAQNVPLDDPRISPIYANLENLPPMQVYASKIEILIDDARKICEKIKEMGGRCEYLQWRSAPHAFPVLARYIPEGKKAIKMAARFINS